MGNAGVAGKCAEPGTEKRGVGVKNRSVEFQGLILHVGEWSSKV
jgi:hypothetical protein